MPTMAAAARVRHARARPRGISAHHRDHREVHADAAPVKCGGACVGDLVEVPDLPRPVESQARDIDGEGEGGERERHGMRDGQKPRCEQQIDQVGKRGEDGVHDERTADVLLLV
jgi:hypothetical protein